MSIPRAVIPQANMQQAMPLLAQFNAARAAAQAQPVPIIAGGQGINPAQLMQYNQGNALQVGSRIDGRQGGTPAVRVGQDDRLRERYLERVEQNNNIQDRTDSRSIYESDRADARTIYSTENAKGAAALLAQQNDARLQRDIENRNENTDRQIEADNKRFERQVKQDEAKLKAQIELKEYEDGLIRNRLADEREIAESKQAAMEGKFGAMVQKPILAYQNWQEYGKSTRYEEYKTKFITSKLQDPKYVQEYQSDTRFGGADFFNQKEPDQSSQNYFIGLAEFIRSKLEGGDPALASGFAPYQFQLDREEARLASLSAQAFKFALEKSIPVDMNPGAQAGGPVTVPGGVQVQGGVPVGGGMQGGGGGVPVGANPLTPNVPIAPGSPAPSAMPSAIPKSQPSTGLTPTQSRELIQKFPDADADGDKQLTEEEIQAFMQNPLIPEAAKSGMMDAARYITGGALLYNQFRTGEQGTKIAQDIMDQEAKVQKANPLTPDADSIKMEQERVRDAALGSKSGQKSDAKKLTSAKQDLKSDQKYLSDLNKKVTKVRGIVKAAKTKAENTNKMMQDAQKRLDDFVKSFGSNALGPHNLRPADKATKDRLEKTLANATKNHTNAQSALQAEEAKLKTLLDNQKDWVSTVNNKRQAVSDAKTRGQTIANNPSQARARSGISAATSDEIIKHNTNLRATGTKYGFTEEQMKKMIGADGKISASALRDELAKQDLGKVSIRLKRLAIAIKANPRALLRGIGKAAVAGGIMIGPELYSVANTVFETRAEQEQAIEEFKAMIKDFEEINRLAEAEVEANNPLTVPNN